MPLGATAWVRGGHCPLSARGQNRTCPPLLLHLHPLLLHFSWKEGDEQQELFMFTFPLTLWGCNTEMQGWGTCDLSWTLLLYQENDRNWDMHSSLSHVCFHLHAVRRKDVSEKWLYGSLSSKSCYYSAWLLGLKGFQFSALSSEYILFWQCDVLLQLFCRSSGWERCDGQIWLLPCAHSEGTRIRGIIANLCRPLVALGSVRFYVCSLFDSFSTLSA